MTDPDHPADHGTDGGYARHRRGSYGTHPTTPCRACKQAHAAKQQLAAGKNPTVVPVVTVWPYPGDMVEGWTPRRAVQIAETTVRTW